jgi:hypothetical protein
VTMQRKYCSLSALRFDQLAQLLSADTNLHNQHQVFLRNLWTYDLPLDLSILIARATSGYFEQLLSD